MPCRLWNFVAPRQPGQARLEPSYPLFSPGQSGLDGLGPDAMHSVPDGELGRLAGVVRVQVERVVVHGEQAEQVVVVLGDRLARPVLVDRADLELFVRAPEFHL